MFKKLRKKVSGDDGANAHADAGSASSQSSVHSRHTSKAPVPHTATPAAALRPSPADEAKIAESKRKQVVYEQMISNMAKTKKLEEDEGKKLERIDADLKKANEMLLKVKNSKDEALKKRVVLQVKKLRDERDRVNARLTDYQKMISTLQDRMEISQHTEAMTEFSKVASENIVSEDAVIDAYEDTREKMEETASIMDYIKGKNEEENYVAEDEFQHLLDLAEEDVSEPAAVHEPTHVSLPAATGMPMPRPAASQVHTNADEEEFRKLERELAS